MMASWNCGMTESEIQQAPTVTYPCFKNTVGVNGALMVGGLHLTSTMCGTPGN